MIENIQCSISNDLSRVLSNGGLFAGIIGDQPSLHAKSPTIWNPTFNALDIPAVYVAFDVTKEKLGALTAALRVCPSYMGGNVTVPHKVAVMEHLDELDDMAKKIGAVNTIVRTDAGKLVGYNTDGKGGIDSLTLRQPNQTRPFLASLDGMQVTLLGAGGAARAVAFHIAEAIGPTGKLTIVNRSSNKAASLAGEIQEAYRNCSSISIEALPELLPGSGLIVNASTVGQSGLRATDAGLSACLEPYSPLASFRGAGHSPIADEHVFLHEWMRVARGDIESNNVSSLAALLDTPVSTAVWDIIFSPLETVLLRQARLTGHKTLNGKGMNVAQAADAFFNRVCRDYLEQRSLRNENTYLQVQDAMYTAW